jgi:hypothetical protein
MCSSVAANFALLSWYVMFFMNPYKRKSSGIRSCDLGGHHQSDNVWCKKVMWMSAIMLKLWSVEDLVTNRLSVTSMYTFLICHLMEEEEGTNVTIFRQPTPWMDSFSLCPFDVVAQVECLHTSICDDCACWLCHTGGRLDKQSVCRYKLFSSINESILVTNSVQRLWSLGMMCWETWILYVCKCRHLRTVSWAIEQESCNSWLVLLVDWCSLLVDAVCTWSTTMSWKNYFTYSQQYQSSHFSQCFVVLQNWFMCGWIRIELMSDMTLQTINRFKFH